MAAPRRSEAPAALILAGGAGRRMGQPKALIELGGQTLLQRAIQVAADAGCAPIIAVLRPGVDLPGLPDVPVDVIAAVNPDPDRGMGSSLRIGLSAAAQADSDVDRLVVLLVDMPTLDSAAVRRVADVIGPDAPLAMASYASGRAHPVAFRRDQWEPISDSIPEDEDRGARVYLAAHPDLLKLVDCSDLAVPGDVDTPDDLRRARAALAADQPGAD